MNLFDDIFFTQLRTGKNGTPFVMYKFRTMVYDAEDKKKQLLSLNEADGPVFKIRDDPRFTPIGRFLAHTGIDEIPQLYNVLLGDMALIGPRPLPIEEAKKLKKWQQQRHAILPGIISPWIIHGYHSMSFDAWMKSDIDYIQNKSLLYDMHLAFRAIGFLLMLFIREMLKKLDTIHLFVITLL